MSFWKRFTVMLGMGIMVSIVAACGAVSENDDPAPKVIQVVADTGCQVEFDELPIPRDDCEFDPNGRYTYAGGYGWVRVADDFVYENGNRPPTGQELIDNPNGDNK